MVQKEFSSILEKHGVKKIKALDTKFDHNLHQAMVEIESDEIRGRNCNSGDAKWLHNA